MSRPRSEITVELHELGIIIDRREIFLGRENHEENGDDTDNQSAMKFVKNMRLLQQFDNRDNPIVVHQINAGGEWFAGMAIYDAIASSESHVTIVCHGMAMSMGGIIAQAADLRIMMPQATFMLHESTSSLGASYKAGQSWAAFDKKASEVILDIFVSKCIGSVQFKDKGEKAVRNEIQRRMDLRTDWILNARETVDYGFADAVLGDTGYETLNKILNVS
jgi:ATP-dependent protease ClpP protease subunit